MSSRTSFAMGGSSVVPSRPVTTDQVLRGGLTPSAPGAADSNPPLPAGAGINETRRAEGATPDSGAPFKRERRRRTKSDKVSMLGLRDLWLMPLLGEVVLMFGAAWMSYCLMRVMQDRQAGFPLGSVLVLAAAYAVLAFYSRLYELFLPRKVVFIGVGTLLVISLGISGAVHGDAYLMGGRSAMTRATLVLMPLHLFILRCLLIFREARFTPSADSLSLRVKCKGDRVSEIRRKLRFWMD